MLWTTSRPPWSDLSTTHERSPATRLVEGYCHRCGSVRTRWEVFVWWGDVCGRALVDSAHSTDCAGAAILGLFLVFFQGSIPSSDGVQRTY